MKQLRAIILCTLLLTVFFAFSGCGASTDTGSDSAPYQQINAEEAKTQMDAAQESGDAFILLDVREQNEYDAGHIPGAQLLPVGTIDKETAAVIPQRDTPVYVYCRSGNRSRAAALALTDLGYTAVYEFGGINDWPYEIE